MPRPLLALAAAVVLLLTAGLAIGLAHELLSPGPCAGLTLPGPARPGPALNASGPTGEPPHLLEWLERRWRATPMPVLESSFADSLSVALAVS